VRYTIVFPPPITYTYDADGEIRRFTFMMQSEICYLSLAPPIRRPFPHFPLAE
jgi:hypothetical protein